MNQNTIPFDKDKLLQPEIMISMYARGAFPMAEKDGEINWYMPETRTVIPVKNYNLPRSLNKFMQQSSFKYKYDANTLEVIKACTHREETWISDQLVEAYERLIVMGYVHSVEVFEKDELVGGLYGISFKGAFFGESMFSKTSQASKAALVKLLERLSKKKFVVLDVQYMTDHLKMFGAEEISYNEYVELLLKAYKKEAKF